MGLNIGFRVRSYAWSPDSISEKKLKKKLDSYLDKRFSKGGFYTNVTSEKIDNWNIEYQIDIRMLDYCKEFEKNYPDTDIYVELFKFIKQEFFTTDGLELEMYWNG